MLGTSLLVASAAAASAFSSPSGTLIVNLKLPSHLGSYTPAKPAEWDLEMFDFAGEKVGFEEEKHPDLPGYVLETIGKRDAVSFGYRLRATYCNPKSECLKKTFKDFVELKAPEG